jgi:hypothetical protein
MNYSSWSRSRSRHTYYVSGGHAATVKSVTVTVTVKATVTVTPALAGSGFCSYVTLCVLIMKSSRAMTRKETCDFNNDEKQGKKIDWKEKKYHESMFESGDERMMMSS